MSTNLNLLRHMASADWSLLLMKRSSMQWEHVVSCETQALISRHECRSSNLLYYSSFGPKYKEKPLTLRAWSQDPWTGFDETWHGWLDRDATHTTTLVGVAVRGWSGHVRDLPHLRVSFLCAVVESSGGAGQWRGWSWLAWYSNSSSKSHRPRSHHFQPRWVSTSHVTTTGERVHHT